MCAAAPHREGAETEMKQLAISWAAFQVAVETIYGEARGEPYEGKVAVAWVLLNRARRPRWWGHDLYSVCLKDRQFSCWNQDDPNRAAIKAASPGNPVMSACIRALLEALSGLAADPTGGADHYCVTSLTPSWAATAMPTAIVGGHKFYRLEV